MARKYKQTSSGIFSQTEQHVKISQWTVADKTNIANEKLQGKTLAYMRSPMIG
jgi:hypothetical protein